MARSDNPAITTDVIRGIKPGETLELSNISIKQRATIYGMVSYTKFMGPPSGVSGYTCSYDRCMKLCRITAIPKGISVKEWKRVNNNIE